MNLFRHNGSAPKMTLTFQCLKLSHKQRQTRNQQKNQNKNRRRRIHQDTLVKFFFLNMQDFYRKDLSFFNIYKKKEISKLKRCLQNYDNKMRHAT